MSDRLKNLNWDKVDDALRQPAGVGLDMMSGSLSATRGGEVHASVQSIDLSADGITVRFRLSPEEDLTAWGNVSNQPFESLKIGGVTVPGAEVIQAPAAETIERGYALVVRSSDADARSALQSILTLSSPVSIDGVLKGGRSVFGFWRPG
jgi:hypothetical protein